MAEERERTGQLALELNCDNLNVQSASFSPGPDGEGGVFSCSIGPVTDETVAALDRAVRVHAPVSLRFSDHPVLLDLVAFERKAPQLVRIVGHVLKRTDKGSA